MEEEGGPWITARWCDKAMQEGLRQIRPEASGYTPTPHKSSVEWGLVIPSAAGRLPLSLCSVSHRCWLCGRPGLSPWLGHAVLDKLHNIHHHPPHSGPDSPGGLREGDRHHHVGRRPSQGICAGRVPEVSCWASGVGSGGRGPVWGRGQERHAPPLLAVWPQ